MSDDALNKRSTQANEIRSIIDVKKLKQKKKSMIKWKGKIEKIHFSFKSK